MRYMCLMWGVCYCDDSHTSWLTVRPEFLEKVYTPYDACILNRKGNCPAPSSDLEKRCSGFYSANPTAREFFATTSKPFPSSLYEIPSTYSGEHDFVKLIRITELLIALNQSNSIMALWGDSVTRDSILSLICIVGIENNFQGVEVDPPNIIADGGYFKFQRILITFRNPTINEIVTSRIFFYQEKGTLNLSKYDAVALQLLTAMSRQIPNSNFLFVLNCGLHLGNYSAMSRRLESLFLFARKKLMRLGKTPWLNQLKYRETSTQHYDNNLGYFTENILSQDHDVICTPSQPIVEYSVDYRHLAEKNVLTKMNIVDADVIRFRELSKHYHDIHPASHFFRMSRDFGRNKDCTHFPYYYNMIYRLLWHRILSKN